MQRLLSIHRKKRGYNRPFYAQGVFPNFKVLGFTFYTLASFVVKNRTRSRQSDLEAMIRCETITARPNGFLTWQTGPVQTYYATAAGGSYDADAWKLHFNFIVMSLKVVTKSSCWHKKWWSIIVVHSHSVTFSWFLECLVRVDELFNYNTLNFSGLIIFWLGLQQQRLPWLLWCMCPVP